MAKRGKPARPSRTREIIALPAKTVKAFMKAKIPGYHKVRGENKISVEKSKVETITLAKGRAQWAVMIARQRNLKYGQIRKVDVPIRAGSVATFRKGLTGHPEIAAILRPGERFAFTFGKNRSYQTFRNLEELEEKLTHYDQNANIAMIQLVRTNFTGPSGQFQSRKWRKSRPPRVAAEARRAAHAPLKKRFRSLKNIEEQKARDAERKAEIRRKLKQNNRKYEKAKRHERERKARSRRRAARRQPRIRRKR